MVVLADTAGGCSIGRRAAAATVTATAMATVACNSGDGVVLACPAAMWLPWGIGQGRTLAPLTKLAQLVSQAGTQQEHSGFGPSVFQWNTPPRCGK